MKPFYIKAVIIGILVGVILAYIVSLTHRKKVNHVIERTSIDDVTPFVDVSERESVKELLLNVGKIRKEVIANMEHFDSIRGDQFFEDIIEDDRWEKIYLKWYKDSPAYAYKLFPETMKIVDKHPEIKLAMFSRLKPGTIIKPHRGPFKGAIRVHIGIKTPNDPECWIKVGGEKYHWKDGEVLGFDDTYTHEVQNNTDKERIILFLDIERRLSSKTVTWLNRRIMKSIAAKTSRTNQNIPEIGT